LHLKHLEVLNRAGLVDRRKKGFWAYFRLAHAPPSVYGASLLADLKNWLEDDREIADIMRSFGYPEQGLLQVEEVNRPR
jgi:DNA-binding transcriptional ArsR family regulator